MDPLWGVRGESSFGVVVGLGLTVDPKDTVYCFHFLFDDRSGIYITCLFE